MTMIVTNVATIVIAVAVVSVAAALTIELGVLQPNSCISHYITISITGNDMMCVCIRYPVN